MALRHREGEGEGVGHTEKVGLAVYDTLVVKDAEKVTETVGVIVLDKHRVGVLERVEVTEEEEERVEEMLGVRDTLGQALGEEVCEGVKQEVDDIDSVAETELLRQRVGETEIVEQPEGENDAVEHTLFVRDTVEVTLAVGQFDRVGDPVKHPLFV